MSQAKPQADGIGRRTFLRRSSAATLGAVGTIAAANHADRLPVDRALAIDDAVVGPDGWEWRETTGVQGLEYLGGVISDAIIGSTRDHSGYTGEDARIANIEENALENKSSNERVLNSIENNIKGSENVALSKGKAALLTEMNDGAEEPDARDAMLDAIDEYYSTIQENLFIHHNAIVAQIHHYFATLDEGDGTVAGDVFYCYNTNYDMVETTAELLDGTVIEYDVFGYTYDYNNSGNQNVRAMFLDPLETTEDGFDFDFDTTNPNSFLDSEDEETRYYNTRVLNALLDDIHESRDNVVSTLSGFSEDVYNAYDPGDIPTEDLVDPITAFSELAQDYDGDQGQMAYASMLGIPTTADASVWIQVLEDSLEDYFDADDFENADEFDELDEDQLDELVDSIPYDAIEADIYTQHVPEDDDGNEVGFETGKHYTPEDWDEPLYIGYTVIYEDDDGEIVEESDFVQLENEFIIFAAEDSDGNDIESFENRSTTAQTADIDELEAELAALREEQLRLQREAQDQGAGLAGIPGLESIAGFLGIGLGSTVVVIGAAVFAYINFVNPISR